MINDQSHLVGLYNLQDKISQIFQEIQKAAGLDSSSKKNGQFISIKVLKWKNEQ